MRLAAITLSTLFLLPVSAGAELVLFKNGHSLHVDSYRVEGAKVILEVGGGTLTVPVALVESVADSELVAALPGAPATTRQPTVLDFSGSDPVPKTPYGKLIHKTARRFRISSQLVAAVAQIESGFDQNAVSPTGEKGLLQVLPITAQKLGVDPSRLLEPEANLEAGIRHLNWLRKRYANDLELVLAAYHAGIAEVDRHGGVPPYPATQSYIRQIHELLGLGS